MVQPGGVSPQIKVTVIISVGNDVRYVRDCVSGILAQEGDFILETIIVKRSGGDEAAELLRDLLALHASVMVLESTASGMRSKVREESSGAWLYDGLQAATGKYIACLRASDWWSSPYLLMDQLTVLEVSRVSQACMTAVVENDVSSYAYSKRLMQMFQCKGTMVSSNEILAEENLGNLSNVLFRKSALNNILREIYCLPFFERLVTAVACSHGILTYLNEEGVVERINVGVRPVSGITTETNSDTTELHEAIERLSGLIDFDRITDHAYHTTVRGLQDKALLKIKAFEFSAIR